MEILGSGLPRRTVFVKIGEGEELPGAVARLLEQLGVGFAYLSGIGGLAEAKLAVFDAERRVYRYVRVEPLQGHVLEVVTLTGNSVEGPDGHHYPHIHVAVARRPGEVYAGHLVEARVKPFLELLVVELPGQLRAMESLSHRWRSPAGLEELAG